METVTAFLILEPSPQNLPSTFGLIDVRMSASDKEKPVCISSWAFLAAKMAQIPRQKAKITTNRLVPAKLVKTSFSAWKE